MDDLTQQLVEELDAFRPKWREEYASLYSAVVAAGAEKLFTRWLSTSNGEKYSQQFGSIPDRVGASKREVEAYRSPSSLPCGYDSLGRTSLVGREESWEPRKR